MSAFLNLFNVSLLGTMLRISTPILLGGLAYIIAARAGVVDMGIEGKLLFSTFVSALVTEKTASPVLGICAAMVACAAVSWLVGLIMVRLQAQQVIVGIGFNFFMTGLTAVLLAIVWNQPSTSPPFGRMESNLSALLSRIPGIGPLFDRQTPTMYLSWVLLLVAFVVMFKTKAGLRMRAVGENPKAADSLGIRVHRYQLVALIVGGMLCGLGGADLSVGQLGYFAKDMIQGRGFIALACAVVGRFHPIGLFVSTSLISLVDGLQIRLQGAFSLAPQFFQMIPYIAPIIVLTFFGGVKAPAAMGLPFQRGER